MRLWQLYYVVYRTSLPYNLASYMQNLFGISNMCPNVYNHTHTPHVIKYMQPQSRPLSLNKGKYMRLQSVPIFFVVRFSLVIWLPGRRGDALVIKSVCRIVWNKALYTIGAGW